MPSIKCHDDPRIRPTAVGPPRLERVAVAAPVATLDPRPSRGAGSRVQPAAAEPLPAVVLSGGITGLGVLRVFSRQGIPVRVHAGPLSADPLRYSRWYRPLLAGSFAPDPGGRIDGAGLEQVLDQAGIERAFLCACSDDWNRAVAELSERGRGGLLSAAPPLPALHALQHKGRLALLLQELELPMPATRPIHDGAELAKLPPGDGTFHFLKPTDSQHFLARFGKKGLRVSSAEEAQRLFEQVAAAGFEVVLQEYVPGPCDRHYFLDGYVDRQGAVKALLARRRLRIDPPDFGNSTAMVSVPLADVGPAVGSLRRVLAAVRYRGIFSAEFKRDPRDEAFKLLEVNTRPWWYVDFAARCGVDVCRMAYDDAQGLPVAAVERYRIGATCIYPYHDLPAVRSLVRGGQMTWSRWVVELARARQPVACLDDPLPAVAALAQQACAALRRRLPGRRA